MAVPSARNSGLDSNLELYPSPVGREDVLDRLGRLHRDGGLLDDDLRPFAHSAIVRATDSNEAQVGSAPRPDPVALGRGVDRDEDDVGGLDAPLTSVEKCRFLPRVLRTTSSSPGS